MYAHLKAYRHDPARCLRHARTEDPIPPSWYDGAGQRSVRFDAGNLLSGIYTAQLTAIHNHHEIKMTLGS
jgi:hypothetical protein